jgi:hypothetical protein
MAGRGSLNVDVSGADGVQTAHGSHATAAGSPLLALASSPPRNGRATQPPAGAVTFASALPSAPTRRTSPRMPFLKLSGSLGPLGPGMPKFWIPSEDDKRSSFRGATAAAAAAAGGGGGTGSDTVTRLPPFVWSSATATNAPSRNMTNALDSTVCTVRFAAGSDVAGSSAA